jgi:NAD(P)-dependent dehydrogenase (short-subunit alcohol dehydrogenase family)
LSVVEHLNTKHNKGATVPQEPVGATTTDPTATGRRLENKVAVVTGAGRGLGRAIALALASAGADVSLAGRNPQPLMEVAAELDGLGVRSLVTVTDVTDQEQVDRLVARTTAEMGGLDILVNNAGVLSSAALVDTTDQEWNRVFDTNLRGTFLMTRAAGRHLVAQGSGKIINVASNFAFKGVPNHAAYCASKAAVVSFTRSMAIEWARHNVQVNALVPGFFATDLNADIRADDELMRRIRRAIPTRRIGDPDDLRAWAVLLASSASDFMTGEVITIDGGETAR